MFGKLFSKHSDKVEGRIRYGRPLDPDTEGMEITETKKSVFPYCREEMVRYSDEPGLCDCCGRYVDRYIISEPEWEGWEAYRISIAAPDIEAATDTDRNYELHLCTECLSTGKAAEKYRVRYFNIPRHVSDEWKIRGYDEVMLCTPDHVGCKTTDSKCVPHHCDEVCELIMRIERGEEIPKEMQGKIIPYSDSQFTDFEAEDFDSMAAKAQQTFLFKCRQCGQCMAIFY